MHSNNQGTTLFLLYVSMMLIITFLQQEFVLIPEIQNIDIVGEDAKLQLMEKYQRLRWLAFLLPPVLLALRLSLVSLCFFIGSFFFAEMGEKKFKDWWNLAIVAQIVMIAYSIFLCVINIVFGSNQALEVSKYTSLLFLAGESIGQWIKLPLSAFNIFEIVYWLIMASLLSKSTGTKLWSSFKFVILTYGVGYLFYIVLLMFLMLYLGTNA